MQKTGFFTKIIFAVLLFEVSAWLSNHAVCKIGLIEFSGTFLTFLSRPCAFDFKVFAKCADMSTKGCFS
jgi:hypothetical protein